MFTDEKSADDVKDMLTDNRNENMDHLPAHQHLLEFLFQEYEDETDVLIDELKLLSGEFPWEKRVLTYCELLVKRGEDDDLEDSFDSKDEEQNNKSEERLEDHRTVFEITVRFLDYEMNKDDGQCWDLLVQSLKMLFSSHKEVSYLEANPWLVTTFEDRGGWWVDQNFHGLGKCDSNLLMKKALVLACLFGKKNEKYLTILTILEQRNLSFPSSSLTSLLKELLESVQKVSKPCLKSFKPDYSGVDRNLNKSEWMRIGLIEKFELGKKNKNYYGDGK